MQSLALKQDVDQPTFGSFLLPMTALDSGQPCLLDMWGERSPWSCPNPCPKQCHKAVLKWLRNLPGTWLGSDTILAWGASPAAAFLLHDADSSLSVAGKPPSAGQPRQKLAGAERPMHAVYNHKATSVHLEDIMSAFVSLFKGGVL